MKKLMFTLATAACACAFAEDAVVKNDGAAEATPAPGAVREVRKEKASWPVWLAFNSTKNIDVIGMRLTLPYGACENVTGFDLGIFGRCRYMEGFQINILRNEAEDVMAGFQIGLYNSSGRADLLGVQAGLWNEAQSIRGVQAGLINLANTVSGFQVGLVNRCESLYGIQVGAVNVIRESDLSFLPIVNIGFETFGTPAF